MRVGNGARSQRIPQASRVSFPQKERSFPQSGDKTGILPTHHMDQREESSPDFPPVCPPARTTETSGVELRREGHRKAQMGKFARGTRGMTQKESGLGLLGSLGFGNGLPNHCHPSNLSKEDSFPVRPPPPRGSDPAESREPNRHVSAKQDT